ncbi:Glycosyl transferase, family 2 [Methanosarcina siciliae HI350]|uniref:Glycosyl transferase, family 2 n=1 Tax=Methanosarcina siciliae HI350 TaxID=1434119 RepID=A0A0E3PHH0_9EURY|nr:glycosyltransferase family 2 protein [Methanosarcina siciliae]AKB33540.1 Glycosyl transferase, family 2 [Methanosarcina siciliae HI350]
MSVELSIVIPAYNEEESVVPCYWEVIEALKPLGKSYEIIFVDDGSTDSTFEKLNELSKTDSRLRVLKLRKNFGQSAALRAGFDHAEGRYIITMDADLQNDPHDIPLLLQKLESEDFDVVCGWRYSRKDTFSKKVYSKFANYLRKKLTHEQIHDSGCTLRAYKKECVNNLELYGELHRYIPAMLGWKGYRIGEIKINHRERQYGKTKYNWKRLFRGFLDLLVVAFWERYSVRPMHVFGGAGLVFGFLGFIISMYLGIMRLVYGRGLSDRPLFLVGILLIIVGVQFLATGVLADILLKIYYGQNGRKNYLI